MGVIRPDGYRTGVWKALWQRGRKGGSFMTSVTYRVTGMTCEHCVRAVSGELRDLEGVSDVAVGLVPGGVSAVTVTSDGPLARQAIADALDEPGYYELAGK
jgi:copper chaperone CopZ